MSIRGPLLFVTGFAAALAAGWTLFPSALYQAKEQPFQFSHAAHQAKSEMPCADCHALRDDGSFAGVPKLENCATCHAAPMGESKMEKRFVEQFVTPGLEPGWHIYSRQPMNVRFSHATHVNVAKLKCEECHGAHGTSTGLRTYYENRISGYSRDIWGSNMARLKLAAHEGMKMSDCEGCHAKHNVDAGCLGCHK